MMFKKVNLIIGIVLLSGCRITANIYEVKKGELIRSAQLEKKELSYLFSKYKVRSVINLRGAKPGTKWYDDEAKMAQKYGVQMASISMSASRLPHRGDLIKLVDAFRDLPRPILVHCKAGADRTGEAVALYAIDYWGQSSDEAQREHLSSRYLHFEVFKPAKDYFVRDVYQGAQWARDYYDPCATKYKYYDQEKYCNGSVGSEKEEEQEIDT